MACAVAFADENRVAWPGNYARTLFVITLSTNRKGTSRRRCVFFYVNTESLIRAKSGEPLPDGTTLIMENRKIVLDVDGKPVTDKLVLPPGFSTFKSFPLTRSLSH